MAASEAVRLMRCCNVFIAGDVHELAGRRYRKIVVGLGSADI
jgi:hypothetical protein